MTVIQEQGADKAGILAALDELAGRAGKDDTVFLFYCGHGALGKDGDYYLVSHDAELEDERVVEGSGVSEGELLAKLHAIKAERLLLVFNVCFSGKIAPTLGAKERRLKARMLSGDAAQAVLGTGSGRILITACRDNQASYVGEGELTVFTQALVDGLNGQGIANRSGYISAYSLYEQVYQHVSQEVGDRYHDIQQPVLNVIQGVGPFAVALYCGARPRAGFDASEELPGGAVQPVKPEQAQRTFAQRVKIQVGGGIAIVGDKNIVSAVVVTHSNTGDVMLNSTKIVEEKHYHTQVETDPASLRIANLNRVFQETAGLSLAGIDPEAASKVESRLNLSSIYTALLTQSLEESERLKMMDRPGESERAARRLSTLEQLDHHSRLVLLGDPGSGKSTFVNFVALCLAGEALGRAEANLALLTAPAPVVDGQSDEKEERRQPWDHGPLLLLRVILCDFAARGLPATGQRATAEHFWKFIAAELEAASLGDYAPHLRRELLATGGLVLLDGLDEVPEAGKRRAQIKQAVEDFAATYKNCRLLVTSRTYAYQKQDWRLADFQSAELAPFNEQQITAFIDRWYAHVAALRGWKMEDAQGRAELLKSAVLNRERLRELAERPLLLTLMASLHAWRSGSLPEKRELLYADTVDLLLDWWERPKLTYDASGRLGCSLTSLAEWLKVDREKVRGLLNELAYKAHAAQPDLAGTADIPEGELLSGLLHLSQNPEADANPALLVEFLSQHAGVLIPRGYGVFTFPHRTFQEYLAACYLTDNDYPDLVADLVRLQPERWREVALLAGAKAARTSERNQEKAQRVGRWLVHIIGHGELPAVERVQAGNRLARLGDPRFDLAHWFLPADSLLGFLHIPAGTFRMGSDPVVDKASASYEQPQHELYLPDYYLERYPVTVAQFSTFVQDSGYQPRDPDSLKGIANHPVVNVTWYDARRYCDWLNDRLHAVAGDFLKSAATDQDKEFWRKLDAGELRVTLPSEAEWEKAARGADGRIYPWGNDFDASKANTFKSGIGATSPVGSFAGGTSPYGLLDMSGNVWEWTDSLWGKDWSKPDFKYPYDPKDGREDQDASRQIKCVMRGGSWGNSRYHASCAYRSWGEPDYFDDSLGFGSCSLPIKLLESWFLAADFCRPPPAGRSIFFIFFQSCIAFLTPWAVNRWGLDH